MHQKLFFPAPIAKFSLPWEGDTPLSYLIPSPARALRSLAILLGGPITRIFEPPPPPEKCLVTGLGEATVSPRLDPPLE